MIKKITVWGVVAVAIVLAVQVLMRSGPPPSLVTPPKMELPGLDSRPEREPSQPAEPAAQERPEGDAAEARRRGLIFLARGNEPAWLLEISHERIELALELGARRVDFPYHDPIVSGARTTYRTFSGTQELNVAVDRTPCNDTMGGEPFESTVSATFGNRTYYGCGRRISYPSRVSP